MFSREIVFQINLMQPVICLQLCDFLWTLYNKFWAGAGCYNSSKGKLLIETDASQTTEFLGLIVKHKEPRRFFFWRKDCSLSNSLLSSQEQLPDNHKPLCWLARVGGGQYFRIYSISRKTNTKSTVIVDSTITMSVFLPYSEFHWMI